MADCAIVFHLLILALLILRPLFMAGGQKVFGSLVPDSVRNRDVQLRYRMRDFGWRVWLIIISWTMARKV